ncbi:Protein of uncharacterised function (DUF2543) [Klebsiella pneumoniae]|nr:Protein of uncharacterised function (DUF2543) [Klebsiella pneumoniae]
MSNDIPLKFYDIVDEYETEAAAPVKDEERDALARYFQLLIARLTNNEEIDEEAQREMAREAAINENRIDDIANFLNQWGQRIKLNVSLPAELPSAGAVGARSAKTQPWPVSSPRRLCSASRNSGNPSGW